ncbi:MAG TPA: DUF2115 domain-containing protein [Methanomicrobiales archaeon]|nr:DUF2115 domain-containing protein [Methanomicrobiales archaeon]
MTDPESLRTRIAAFSAKMRRAASKRALAELVAGEVATYTLHDLQQLRGSVEHDLRHVPPHYRAKLEPRMMEHLFGTHHAIMLRYRREGFHDLRGPVEGKIGEFCDLLLGLPDRDDRDGRDLRLVLLYYLIAAYTIFACGLPGHPVGTPFPGGFLVEEKDGTYYCPVREKEDEVETSICPFCPAEQSRLPGDEPL